MENKGNNVKKDIIICNVIYNEELWDENIIGEILIDDKLLIPYFEKYAKNDNILKSIYNNSNNYKSLMSSIKTQSDFAKMVVYKFYEAISKNDDEWIKSFSISEDKLYKKTPLYKKEVTYVEPVYEQVYQPVNEQVDELIQENSFYKSMIWSLHTEPIKLV